MIELNTVYGNTRTPDQPGAAHPDRLRFSFPDVHPQARFDLEFQRTLRIPDDGNDYPLPPGLGRFPLRHVDDFADRLPGSWKEHGGVMLPMFQSEAMWLNFSSGTGYPFLVKVAAGMINAVTGGSWDNTPHRHPQDYLVVPNQPWLDGFCIGKGIVRQFTAASLDKGYSVEEQVTGEGTYGGLQVIAYPLQAEVWRRLQAQRRRKEKAMPVVRCLVSGNEVGFQADMGLAMGGRMKQDISSDSYKFEDWNLEHSSRCYIHLANSLAWRAITGEAPPTLPPTAEHYSQHGLPWFEYYSEGDSIEGSNILNGLKSVNRIDAEGPAGTGILPENTTATPTHIVRVGRDADKVREF